MKKAFLMKGRWIFLIVMAASLSLTAISFQRDIPAEQAKLKYATEEGGT
jgi:hypothetical protein